jgi:SAM-dependent methyltransferase/ribosomal protein S27AE
MMSEKIHRNQASCPVCGFEGTSEPAVGLARDKEPGYVRALAEGLGAPIQAIVKPLRDRACSRCGTVFVNPTLSDTALNRIYLTHAPIHNWGWGRFTKKLLADPPETGEVEALEAFIRSEVGLPNKYLEVGCPFGGFAIMWSDGSKIRQAVTSCRGQNFYSQRGYRNLLKFDVKLTAISLRISSMITRFWMQLMRIKRRKVDPATATVEGGIQLTHLSQFSMNQWSYGCRAFGMTCTEMASRGMEADVLSLGRLKGMPDDTFDLAGIINSLDHADNPLELLSEVARVSKKVIVSGHRLIDAHMQHRFAFSDETLPKLASVLKLSCHDVSSALGGHSKKWFAFILAKP